MSGPPLLSCRLVIHSLLSGSTMPSPSSSCPSFPHCRPCLSHALKCHNIHCCLGIEGRAGAGLSHVCLCSLKGRHGKGPNACRQTCHVKNARLNAKACCCQPYMLPLLPWQIMKAYEGGGGHMLNVKGDRHERDRRRWTQNRETGAKTQG